MALHDGTERRNLDALRDLGCYLAIDDFGTGHANFHYVEKFPFNVLKIDKTYISGLGRSAADDAFVGSLCELGRRRNIVVVAEGIETEEQFGLLREMGCPRVQGFLLGRPAPIDVWAGVRNLSMGQEVNFGTPDVDIVERCRLELSSIDRMLQSGL